MRSDMTKRSENRFSLYLDADLKERLDELPDGKANEFINQAIRERFQEIDAEEAGVCVKGSRAELESEIRSLSMNVHNIRGTMESLISNLHNTMNLQQADRELMRKQFEELKSDIYVLQRDKKDKKQ